VAKSKNGSDSLVSAYPCVQTVKRVSFMTFMSDVTVSYIVLFHVTSLSTVYKSGQWLQCLISSCSWQLRTKSSPPW